MTLTKVFEPIAIGGLEIPNRIVSSAHGTAFSSPPRLLGGEDLIAYHVARAKGGVGLSVLEAMAVHPSSQALTVSDDRVVERYEELVRAVRPHGMRLFQQLCHIGNLQAGTVSGEIAWGVSTVPSLNGVVGQPMTTGQIDEVVGAFGAAARRCAEGGLDGVELHVCHGTLPYSFLSPIYNTRRDGYGGPLEHRLRLTREILRAMRDAVGPGVVVGIRLGASEMPGSVEEDELRLVVDALERDGLIDYLTKTFGDFYRAVAISGGMEYASGYQLPSVARFGSQASVPTIVTGRIRTLAEAERILTDGAADLVSMVRALIADPDIVAKSRAGRAQEIRPCIACNQLCLGGTLRTPPRVGCTVNPVVGFERTLAEDRIEPAEHPGRVLVVGGGPAGLEAARVAALGGHDVTLVEATSGLGGALTAARRAPRYALLGDIVDWLAQAVARAGVTVELDTHLSAEAAAARGADAVIVATGSQPRLDGFQHARPFQPALGVGQAHVLSASRLLSDGPPDGAQTALVLDTVGHFEALAAAEQLIHLGLAVTVVTSLAAFPGPGVQATQRDATALEYLSGGDFTVLPRHHLAEIGAGTCVVGPLYNNDVTREVAADVVVLVTQNEPCRGIYDELLAAGVPGVSIIGDAASPRDLSAAMAEGHRVARALPSDIRRLSRAAPTA